MYQRAITTFVGRTLTVFLGIVLWLYSSAHAASFDCSKASSRVEKVICTNEELSGLDEDLEFSYRMILESLVFAYETIEKDRIQAEQRKWLKKDRDVCPDVACLHLAYEARIRHLNNEKEFSNLASQMTSIYKTYLSVSSEVDAERIQTEQNRWQKAVRDSCQDAACLCSAYEARSLQLKKEAEQDIRQYWETDGYWYFYAKAKKGRDGRHLPTVMASVSLDGSDTLLALGGPWSLGNIWVNALRFATQKEMGQTSTRNFGTSYSQLCNGNTVIWEAVSNAKVTHPINNRVVIRTPQQADDYGCEDCMSFAIFREIDPPEKRKMLLEDHQDPSEPLIIPVRSEIYKVEVLNDCTILAKIDEGVIRFREDGTTDAVLPPGMRLVNGKKIPQWENEFNESFDGDYERALQHKLWFFYHKIFERKNQ